MNRRAIDADEVSPRRARVLFVIAVCLIGANMRISVYAVGPLLELVAAEEAMASSALGALVSIPLVAWGVVSAFTHSLGTRFGVHRTVSWSLVVLALGTVLRSLPGPMLNVWLGTAIIGAALAIGNVLIPTVIRREFSDRISLMVGLYTGIMAIVGAIGAGLMVPIAQIEVDGRPLGWRVALLSTAVVIIPALVFWVLANRAGRKASSRAPTPSSPPATSARRSAWRDRVAWLVAVYMGTQSASFYILSTWISSISIGHGKSSVAAGFDVMAFQITSIVGSLLLPVVFRGRFVRWLPAALPVLMIPTSVGLVFAEDWTTALALVGGVLAGLSLGVGLTLPLIKTVDVPGASSLSGMAQSVGYLIAALGPVMFGALFNVGGSWLLPTAFLVALGCMQLISGFVVGDPRRIALRPSPEKG